MATKKWFGHHQTTIPLVIETSLIAIVGEFQLPNG
jgi:hypothetical protein